MHIAKCGGNAIREKFRSQQFRMITACDWKCPHTNSLGKCKYILPQKDDRSKTLYTFIHHTLSRPKVSDDFIFTVVRNPYSWYISLWSYGLVVNKINTININDFRKWLVENVGVYTKSFKQACYAEGNPTKEMVIDLFIKLENLSEGLSELEQKTGITFSTDTVKVVNSSKHRQKDYTEYYTPELLHLVYEKDKVIFDKFGYTINFDS